MTESLQAGLGPRYVVAGIVTVVTAIWLAAYVMPDLQLWLWIGLHLRAYAILLLMLTLAAWLALYRIRRSAAILIVQVTFTSIVLGAVIYWMSVSA